MKRKQVFGSLLALLATTSLLTACGSKKKDKAVKDDNSPLTVWASFLQPSQSVSNWKESPFHSGLEKASGVKVNWEFPAEGTESTQAFNLLMADQNNGLPDIIGYGIRDDAEQYIEDGIIQDLTEIIKDKAPNYYKFLQENPDLEKSVKTDSGKIFGFGIFREDPIQGAFYGPIIRKDLLDENGLEMPKNIDELTNALKVIHDKTGAQLSFEPSVLNQSGFAGGFGAHGSFSLKFYLDNDTVKVGQIQPEWKDYMSWLNQLYKDQLLDPDFVTMDDEGLKTKAANGKLSMTYNLGSRKKIYTENSGGKQTWEWAPYPNQKNGEKSADIFTEGRTQSPTWVVTKHATGKRLDDAMKWLDYAYSEEGNTYWNFGEKGVSWEEKDGKPAFTDKVSKNALGEKEGRVLYTGVSGTGLGVQLLATLGAKEDQPGVIWNDHNTAAEKAKLPSTVTLTAAESKESATLINTLSAYCQESALKFVTGEESLDNFDDFVKELKSQGLDRLVEIEQTAYNRYLKR